MNTASLARCPSCQAIVNVNWKACLACRKSVETNSVGQPAEAGQITPGSSIEWDVGGERRSGVLARFHPHRPGRLLLAVCHSAGWGMGRGQQAIYDRT